MGASQIPAASTGGSSDNYVLISSVTPTAAATTVSFTSISGYKKLMLRTLKPGLGTTGTVTLTFNSDSGTNYAYQAVEYTASSGAALTIYRGSDATGIAFGTNTGTLEQNLIINDANTTGVKTISGFVYAGTGGKAYPALQGMYFASAAITTVTLTVTTTFAASGTVALYGVAA